MKWYYWLPAIAGVLLVYEIVRRRCRSYLQVLFSRSIDGLRRIATWCTVGLMRSLHRLHNWLQPATVPSREYAALTPTDNADQDRIYEQILSSGLERPDVQNIALTGSYGSGKSSVLVTFKKRHPEYHYLTISLAAITSEKPIAPKQEAARPEADSMKPPEPSAPKIGSITYWTPQLSEQIEYCILQQMFYHVRGRQIPFSHFKRVRGKSRLSLWFLTIAMLLLLLAVGYLFIFKDTTPLPQNWSHWLGAHDNLLRPLSWLTLLIATLVIIFSALRLYRNTQLIKIDLHSAQLEISPQGDASVLNRHLDEILYFFSEVPIDIVLIEDLDRFNVPEIFLKLREINALINNAKEVGRKVTFIYALRDNVFVNEDRTKFFDLLVPVIPVTNASNAAAMLNREIAKMDLPQPIPDSFLSDLGFFIQDTRLLLNIANEFRIYQAQLRGFDIDYAHLLAIIVYKNKHPLDFAGLQYNCGMIYDHFQNRAIYNEKILEKLIAQRNELTEQLEAVKKNTFQSIAELRTVYLAALYKEIHEKAQNGFTGKLVIPSGWGRDISQMVEDANFDAIWNQTRVVYMDNNNNHRGIVIEFKKLESRVNDQSYRSRANALEQLLQLQREQLESQLEQVNQRIQEIRNYSMQELMSLPEMRTIDTPIDQHPLLVYLTTSGYLNEMYSYYLSRFTEGEITKGDFDFLWSVKYRRKLDWRHNLHKLPALIRYLDTKEFSQMEMLNFDMASYLVTDGKGQIEKIERFMRQLQPLDGNATLFIDQYLMAGKAISEMVHALCRYVPTFWRFILLQSNYTSEKINRYLQLIILHADVADINRQDEGGILANYMSRQSFLLAPAANGIGLQSLQPICDALQLRFDLPDESLKPEKEMMAYIYAHNRYVLNQRMLTLVLKNILPDYNPVTFEPSQYTQIKNSQLHPLKAYIEANFGHYIKEVFLKIDNHNGESPSSILKILNDGNIDIETRKRVVSDTGFMLPDITECKEIQLWDMLVEYARVKASWSNVSMYYHTSPTEDDGPNKVSDSLITFLNLPATAQALSEQRVTRTEGDDSTAIMLKDICTSGRLNDDVFSRYLLVMHFQMKEVDFKYLNVKQAQMMLEERKVAFDLKSFENLQEHHPILAATWALAHWKEYRQIWEQLQLDTDDWAFLLLAPELRDDQRDFLIAQMPDDEIIPLLEKGVDIPDDIFATKDLEVGHNKLLDLAGNQQVRRGSVVQLLIPNLGDWDNEQVREVLSTMGGDFAELANGQQQVKVEKSDLMNSLLEALQISRLVHTFEPKQKYIHVRLQPAPTGDV